VTSDYEMQPWQAMETATVGGVSYKQTAEVEIPQNGYGLSFVMNVAQTLDYAFVTTLSNQNGHRLELDKKYGLYLQVSGDFKPKRWYTIITPTSNGIGFTKPQELEIT
jgi:hypothetical protein